MNRGLNYLIVDDDPSQLYLVQLLLADLGLNHHCHYLLSGQQTLDFLHRKHPYEEAPRPDLILLDLNMPGMTGCEILSILKKDPHTRSIPTIILSSSRAPKDVDACYREHANAYIQKPSDLSGNLKVLAEIDRFWSQVILPHS